MNIDNFSIDKLCRWYTIHSSLYYQYDNPVISDYDFDLICKRLLDNYDNITDEWRVFITKDNLVAGTGYDIAFSSLPKMCLCVIDILRTGRDFSGNDINLEEWLK